MNTQLFSLTNELTEGITGADISIQDCPFDKAAIEAIYQLNKKFENDYLSLLKIEPALNRSLVSFQANKKRAIYRWCKYKEGFSAEMVEYFLHRYNIHKGILFDPFAGSGTALFVASEHGLDAEGIELLPIGQCIIETKQTIDKRFTKKDISVINYWAAKYPWQKSMPTVQLNTLRITKGAYPKNTEESISKYISLAKKQSPSIRAILNFALLCILESLSYTRKDGQYLRWDHRSGRRQGAKIFDKGIIYPFDKAISQKLSEIVFDLQTANKKETLFDLSYNQGQIKLHSGSCLEILPQIPASSYSSIITSPPYCNRYDYTRTYALELALLGVSEDALVKLRQDMVSCTVENRAKDLIQMNSKWAKAINAANNQTLLQAVLNYLDNEKSNNRLNNNGIPKMVRGYFYEMACVISECARVLKKGSPLIMVNDNVRYAGVSISVDIILSEIARSLGFSVEEILILPQGKGNSSQQMGIHGRESLRKCVYLWRKK